MKKDNIIIHRVNNIELLKSIDYKFGCEVDIRTNGSKLILNHDPFKSGENLIDYLDEYRHGTLVLNIKETGIENTVLEEVQKRNIKSYFLLDVEMPYVIKECLKTKQNIAVRFSEFEPIESAVLFRNKLNWIWIDTVTKLPINQQNFNIINQFNVCIVCPSLWHRTEDIVKIKRKLYKFNFDNINVITKKKYANEWLKTF